MAGSLSLEEKFEHLLKASAKKDAQLEYLRGKLAQAMRNNQGEVQSSHSSSECNSVEEESKNNPLQTSDEELN